MKYESIISDVFQYFLENGLMECRGKKTGYQMQIDLKTGKHYFKNDDNPEQMMIGYVKKKNQRTFLCMGLLEKIEGRIAEQVFFCRIFSEPFVSANVHKYYLEQGIVGLQESGMTLDPLVNINYGIPISLLVMLKQQRNELYRLFCHYDIMNLPNYLELTEKHIIRRTITIGDGPWGCRETNVDCSAQCQLAPLSEKEKEILDFIYRKVQEEKIMLEAAGIKSEDSNKAYVLKEKK